MSKEENSSITTSKTTLSDDSPKVRGKKPKNHVLNNSVLNSDRIYMSVSEAASYLRVSISTVYSWVHKRVIPHRKPRGRITFLKSELDQWCDNSLIPPVL